MNLQALWSPLPPAALVVDVIVVVSEREHSLIEFAVAAKQGKDYCSTSSTSAVVVADAVADAGAHAGWSSRIAAWSSPADPAVVVVAPEIVNVVMVVAGVGNDDGIVGVLVVAVVEFVAAVVVDDDDVAWRTTHVH